MKLKQFLNPRYIAIIGVSSSPEKVGRKIFDNLILSGVKVFPINNKETNIPKTKLYSNIENLPIKDWKNILVIIAIPAKFVISEIIKCSNLGVKNIIVISAGFKEAGLEGKKMENEISQLAIKNKLNILGPNCLGFINGKKSINATFSNYYSDNKVNKKNNIAFLSQSGAIGSAVLDWLVNKNIGLSYFVSLGNKAVLNENDFFEFLSKDKDTDLIIVYLEEISQGKRFLELVSRISKIKPIAVLKSGRTSLGEKMTMSHTGSLAGSHDIVLTALKRSGAIILGNINEIYNLMRLIRGPVKNIVKKNNNLAIISNAGGPVVLAVDEAIDNNIELKNFSRETINKLKKILPPLTHIKNPLDILGDADPFRYERVLNIVLADKKISSVLIILTPQSMTKVEETAEIIGRIKSRYKNKLICTCFLGGFEVSRGKKVLAKYFIPNFDSLEEAIQILSKYNNYLENRKDIKPYISIKKPDIDQEVNNSQVLDYIKSFNLLRNYGIKVVAPRKLNVNNLDKIKYPVVIKFVGPDFIHKTDKKAVFLGVDNKNEASKILTSFNNLFSKNNNLENYIIYQPLLEQKIEMFLGLKNDPVFGPVVLLGLGGIYAEIYKDIVMEIADLDKKRALDMIRSLKFYPILNGARGKNKINFNLLIDTILKFSKIINNEKNISEIDINPLFVDDKEIVAVDVRIINK